MDKFWINKLRELKAELSRHLLEKIRFESRRDRTSLQDLRIGQKLKREDEDLRSQFAQLAEFATGVPSEKFNFRLEQKSRYSFTPDGRLYFGPSALVDSLPYVAFDANKLFGPQNSKEPNLPEPEKETATKPRKSMADHITDKFSTAPFIHLDQTRFTKLKPARFDHQLDKFVGNVSKIDKYISTITDKFTSEPPEDQETLNFYIYEGEFVYLTRKSRWAAVRTRILTQKDYFQPLAAGGKPPRRLKAIDPGSYLEPEDVVEYITDDLAEPIASPSTDKGLGYFVPTRRVGRSQPTLLRPPSKPVHHKAVEETPTIPVLGSLEFVQEIYNKSQAADKPIDEIGPAFVNRTGRKTERARAFAAVLRGKLTQPKSDPVRKAVVALLPGIDAIVKRAQSQDSDAEESLSVLERQFDQIVQAQVKSFRVASRALGQSKVSPVIQAGKLESLFKTPLVDSLGLFGKYLPDQSKAETTMGLLALPTEKSAGGAGTGESISEMIRSFSVGGKPSIEKEFEEIQLAGVPDSTGKVSKGIAGVMGKLLSSLIKSRTARVFPTMKPAKPGELAATLQTGAQAQTGTGSAQDFSSKILEKITGSGIAQGVFAKFGDLLEPAKLFSSLLSKKDTRSRIGKLLKPAELGKLTEDILTVDKFEKVKDKIFGAGKQPAGLLSTLLGAARQATAMGSILKPGRLGLSLSARPKDLLAALATGAESGKTGASKVLKLGAKLPSLFKKIFDKEGPKEAVQGTPESLPAGIHSIVEKVKKLTGKLGLSAGKAEKFAQSILGGSPAGSVPGSASGSPAAISAQAPVGVLGSAISRGTQALPGRAQSSSASQIGSLAVPGLGAGGAQQGVTGMMSGQFDQMAAGKISKIGSFMGKASGMRLNLPASGLPQIPMETPEMLSGLKPGTLGDLAIPGVGKMPDMKLPSKIPMKSGLALPSMIKPPKLPKGWDRPPFEVGDAIQKHLKAKAKQASDTPSHPRASRLEDYGMSVIDLEESKTDEYKSPLQQFSEAGQLEIDDATMDQIYFRLKRILETEEERAGGEV